MLFSSNILATSCVKQMECESHSLRIIIVFHLFFTRTVKQYTFKTRVLIFCSSGSSECLLTWTMTTLEDPETLPCSFEFHKFVGEVGEVRMQCQIIKMEKSLYLWIGDCNEKSMADLSLAFAMDNDAKKTILSTKIMGSIADETSTNFATRLSKKLQVPVYVSFNLNIDNRSLPFVEKRIHEEFKNHPELLKL